MNNHLTKIIAIVAGVGVTAGVGLVAVYIVNYGLGISVNYKYGG